MVTNTPNTIYIIDTSSILSQKDIVLFKLKGKTQSEIAEKLGFTQGAIAKRLKKIKAKFYSI